MNLNIEKEYKILVTEAEFVALLKQYPQAKFKKQVNTYYDTDALTIRHTYGAMRIREVDGHFLFTLKQHTENGLLEHELPVSSNDESVFTKGEVKQLLEHLGITEPIKQITTLTTYRAMIETGVAELCFDYSLYRDKHDFEIEYEYKQTHDGRKIFNELLSSVGLYYTTNCTSKIQRALDER